MAVPHYPDDSDGDALRRVAADGNDMDSPMLIEFPVVVASEAQAEQFAGAARERGFEADLCEHDDDTQWDVICAIKMTPTYDEIVRIQDDLNRLAKPFGGHSDGWGTFGNKPGAESADQ
jgi:regulator of RNase E activity RraB